LYLLVHDAASYIFAVEWQSFAWGTRFVWSREREHIRNGGRGEGKAGGRHSVTDANYDGLGGGGGIDDTLENIIEAGGAMPIKS